MPYSLAPRYTETVYCEFLRWKGATLMRQWGIRPAAAEGGLLGVQRAFQVAGTGTTVASLWKVDDLQTTALMKRFYFNLWKQEMSRLDALREAQLWMLKEGPRRDVRLRAQDPAEEPSTRSPPYYWGSFVLSGDWR